MFGGWAKAQKEHFDEGGLFDRIYQPGSEVERDALIAAPPSVLPGFAPTLGFTLFYLGLLVLIPLGGVFIKTSSLTLARSSGAVASPRALASYQLTLGASAARRDDQRRLRPDRRVGARPVHVSGAAAGRCAWSICRLRCRRRSPGIALTAVYSQNGWIGAVSRGRRASRWRSRRSASCGPDVHRPAVRRANGPARAAGPGAGTRRGRRVARGVAVADVQARAAARRSLPALLTGFTLAFARALGEYGSVDLHLRQPAVQDGDHARCSS